MDVSSLTTAQQLRHSAQYNKHFTLVIYSCRKINCSSGWSYRGSLGWLKYFEIFYLPVPVVGFEPSILGLSAKCSATVQPELTEDGNLILEKHASLFVLYGMNCTSKMVMKKATAEPQLLRKTFTAYAAATSILKTSAVIAFLQQQIT